MYRSAEDERDLPEVLDDVALRQQNRDYGNTGGVSCHNAVSGFRPAFFNTRTGESVISRFDDGQPAPIHILEGLPPEWVASRHPDGRVRAIERAVVVGFLYQGNFYTRDEAARQLAQP